jgi:hypothetical protein
MQLVAFGAQDIYLSSNPQVTFFKVVYRRHTNFAMESIEGVFNGQADFGRRVTCTVSRNGDLIHKTYLTISLPSVTVAAGQAFKWVDWVGHRIVNYIEMEIGGQRIDKHYGDWLHIWNELTQTAGHRLGYANMVGMTPELAAPTLGPATVPAQTLYIPFEFYYCRHVGLSLPLIALQYHEVKFNIDFAPLASCYWAAAYTTDGDGVITFTSSNVASYSQLSFNAILWIDFVYCDTDERRRFAQSAHEYLIEQLQYTGAESTSQTQNKIKMSFNHPTKELIWVVQPDDNVQMGTATAATNFLPQWFNYTDAYDKSYNQDFVYNVGSTALDPPTTNNKSGGMPGLAAGGACGVYTPVTFDGGKNPVVDGLIQLNGHDRFDRREGRYFNLVQPYQAHENVPKAGINVYSFALKPEEHQPSGTCNLSRIDTATLNITLTNNTVTNAGTGTRSAKIKIYAVNYNVLRIMSGMGGLAYSN